MSRPSIRLDDVDPKKLEQATPPVNPTPEPKPPVNDDLFDDPDDDLEPAPEPSADLAKLKAEAEAARQEAAQLKQVIQNISSDPLSVEFLNRRMKGEKLKIVTEGDEPPASPTPANKEPAVPDSVDLETLSNSELVKHIVSQVTETLSTTLQSQVSSQIEELKNELSGVNEFVQTSQKQQLSQQIERLRSQNPDFDDYKVDMLNLSKQHPSLGVEELFYLAKSRAGGWNKPNPSTERPTNTSVPAKRRESHGRGRAGFQSALSEALGNITLDI